MIGIKRYEISNDTKTLAGVLFDLPYNSYDVSCKVIELQKEVNRLKDMMQRIEDKLIIDISLEKDENGKLLYSNQSVREAEARIRLDDNARYNDLKQEKIDKENDLAKMKEQSNAYAQMFSTIKNEVFHRRNLELLDSKKELNQKEVKVLE